MKPLVLAACVLLFSFLASAADLPDFPFIYCQGNARLDVKPDLARVSFEVKAFAAKPEDALAVVQDRTRELLQLFSDLKVAKADIEAHEVSKSEVRKREQERGPAMELVGYDIGRRITVTLRKLDDYSRFVTVLLKKENVIDIESSFDRTDKTEMEAKVLEQAMEDAKNRATRLAKVAGARVAKVQAISEEGFNNLAGHFGLGYDRGGGYGAAGPPGGEDLFAVPETITVCQTVNIIVQLEHGK